MWPMKTMMHFCSLSDNALWNKTKWLFQVLVIYGIIDFVAHAYNVKQGGQEEEAACSEADVGRMC